MNSFGLFPMGVAVVAVIASAAAQRVCSRLILRSRLAALTATAAVPPEPWQAPWASEGHSQNVVLWKQLTDRFGRAGYWTEHERRQARRHGAALTIVTVSLAVLVGTQIGSRGAIIGAVVVGLYAGVVGWLYFLKWKAADYERELLYQLPITLESLVLLVESGLGMLPAIAALIEAEDVKTGINPAVRVLRAAYDLSASGLPFASSLEAVANALESRPVRHVLLHLDISGGEGGRLGPAIRGLSDHCHSEWRLSVETRVRRLENLVVFPVFLSVMGLLLLTAAVPIVPLVEFAKSLNNKPAVAGASEVSRDAGIFGGRTEE